MTARSVQHSSTTAGRPAVVVLRPKWNLTA
ncbi:hypothetical protein J2805_000071 [Arthrobacter oryzae]|nr:hypothetical protein [Arthrobacter oryzae]